jgi:hypothetical protein
MNISKKRRKLRKREDSKNFKAKRKLRDKRVRV